MGLLSLGSLSTILILLIVGIPAGFIAMNPQGAFEVFVSVADFISVTVVDIFKGGMAMVWWLFQALYRSIANLFIGAANLVIAKIDNFFKSHLFGWEPIGQFEYLGPPEVDPTISAIIDNVIDRYLNLKIKISDYWGTVQANAPQSYLIGAGVSGGSMLATYVVLSLALKGDYVIKMSHKD